MPARQHPPPTWLLLAHRLKIVWCTKLSRAETDDERGRIEAEMQGSPDTSAILAALHATRTSARDRQSAMERSIREEARKLRQGEAGEQECVWFCKGFLGWSGIRVRGRPVSTGCALL